MILQHSDTLMHQCLVLTQRMWPCLNSTYPKILNLKDQIHFSVISLCKRLHSRVDTTLVPPAGWWPHAGYIHVSRDFPPASWPPGEETNQRGITRVWQWDAGGGGKESGVRTIATEPRDVIWELLQNWNQEQKGCTLRLDDFYWHSLKPVDIALSGNFARKFVTL